MTIPSPVRALFTDFSDIWRVISGPARIRGVFLFGSMAAQALLELAFILVLSYMAQALTNPQGLNATPLFRGIYCIFPDMRLWAEDSRRLMVIAGAVVVLLSVLKNVFAYLTTRATLYLSERISITLGREMMGHYLNAPYTWHLSGDSSTTIQRMKWRGLIASMLISLLSMYANILTMLVLFCSLVGNEPVLTIMVVGITAAVGMVLYSSIRRNVDCAAKLAAESAQAETRALLCATRGIRDVLIYRQQHIFQQQITHAAEKGVAARAFGNMAPTMPTWVLEATGFTVVVVALTYLVFCEQADIPRISGALSMLLLTAWRVLPYANRVVSCQVGIRSIRHRVQQVLELLQHLRSQKKAQAVVPDPGFLLAGEIRFEHVIFRYPEAGRDSICDVSFTLPVGKTLGLIGPSGGGKSTLVGLISGLLAPQGGKIWVDGQELTAERAAALSQQIGYVPQTPFLFAGTLAENVAFSQWGQELDMERVARACQRAAIDFVDEKSGGYERKIGENGAGLSGGQAQRVSIARALFTEPRLLIFDEATSALDQKAERAIQRTIDSLANGITCVMVAHRLSTVEHCDWLMWVDKGRIVMQGPPQEVLAAYKT